MQKGAIIQCLIHMFEAVTVDNIGNFYFIHIILKILNSFRVENNWLKLGNAGCYVYQGHSSKLICLFTHLFVFLRYIKYYFIYRVFTKIKSRSAHMKSHRPPDAEPIKRKEKDVVVSSNFDASVPSPFST